MHCLGWLPVGSVGVSVSRSQMGAEKSSGKRMRIQGVPKKWCIAISLHSEENRSLHRPEAKPRSQMGAEDSSVKRMRIQGVPKNGA